jgi:MFS transporter, DHA2 family, methylenomycin A resistance protein
VSAAATPSPTSDSGTAPLNRWAALATVCLALAVIAINTTAINTAIPAIGDEFDAAASSLTWALNAYLLAVAALVTVGGQLGDVLGKRRAYLIGVVIFAAGSVCVAVAPDIWVVVLGRALQGTGAAFLMPGTIAIISEVFPPDQRGTAIGVWGAIGGICFAIGPLYGGFFTDVIDWRVIFWSDLLILTVAAYLGLTTLRGLRPGAGTRVDGRGAVLLSLGLLLVVLAIEEAPDWGWGSPAFLGALAAGLVLLVLFTAVELREENPLVHFRLLRIRMFDGGNVATFGCTIGLIGLLYFFNLYVQSSAVFDYSALRASAVLLPYGVTMFFFSMVGGRVADRVGYRVPVVGALVVAAIGFFLFSRFSLATGESDLWLPMVLAGVGVGVTFSTTSAAGMVAVPDDKAGEAAGLINMSRYLGAVFVVTLGSILYGDPAGKRATVEGFTDANLMMAVSILAIAVVCLWLLAPDRRSRA